MADHYQPQLVPVHRSPADYADVWSFGPLAQWKEFEQFLRGVDWAAVAAGPPVRPQPPAIQPRTAKNGQTIAVIKMTGTLMKNLPFFGGTSTVQVREAVQQSAADPNVSGILLAIDSPGGTVAGSKSLVDDIFKAQRGKNGKPVWAHADGLVASAAYRAAAAAGMVYAETDDTLAGSIGTILTMYDTSRMAEKAGVVPRVFATGGLKGAGTPGTPITDEQANHFQGIVNAMQVGFDEDVKKGRGLSSTALAEAKTGAVFTATEALRMRLIDGIQPMSKTIEALAAAK